MSRFGQNAQGRARGPSGRARSVRGGSTHLIGPRAFSRVLLHAVRPGLFTVGPFAFLASWNDFFAPLILINDGAKFTLPGAVVSLTNRTVGAIGYGQLEAGVMVMALPCLVLSLVLQRYYVRGFLSGALRG
jgi:multiple sugar transport system permease protein